MGKGYGPGNRFLALALFYHELLQSITSFHQYMKLIFLLSSFFVCSFLHFAKGADAKFSVDGYQIKVKIVSKQPTKIYFGRYKGNNVEFLDTLSTNENSEAIFYGEKKLAAGIYFIGYQPLQENLDFLIDKEQHFEMIVNDSNSNYVVTEFKNSSENNLYNYYKGYISEQSLLIESLRLKLSDPNYSKDSTELIKELKNIDKKIQDKRNEIIANNNKSFLSKLLLTLKDVELPKDLQKPSNKADSLKTLKYLSNHFLDNVDFSDGRLIYTPFFESKVDTYFLDYMDLNADSVIVTLKKMLNQAVIDKTMTEWLLTKLLNGSISHFYKWDESVYIFLFQNYISDNKYDWLNDRSREFYTDKALFYMSISKGKKAPEILLPSITDNEISLLKSEAKYTILSFWDITCHHCLETLPKLDSIYQANWKHNGVKIFSVCVGDKEFKGEWRNYINKSQLQTWNNVFNSIDLNDNSAGLSRNLVLQNYNVWYYPTFFLLDENKHLMAKKLSYVQIVKLLDSVLKK